VTDLTRSDVSVSPGGSRQAPPAQDWKGEYVHMAQRHGREMRRLIALADLFEDWLVDQGYSSFDAGAIVSRLYAQATERADRR